MGSRRLKQWLLQPERDRNAAQARLGAISALRDANSGGSGTLAKLRLLLKGSSDVQRITARIALRQVRPRELVGLLQTLQQTALIAPLLQGLEPYFEKTDKTIERISKITKGLLGLSRRADNDFKKRIAIDDIIDESYQLISENLVQSQIKFDVKRRTF